MLGLIIFIIFIIWLAWDEFQPYRGVKKNSDSDLKNHKQNQITKSGIVLKEDFNNSVKTNQKTELINNKFNFTDKHFSTTSDTKVVVLGSSSKGNSIAIWNDEECIIVDCGLSKSRTLKILKELQIDINIIKAVVFTHNHSDHVNDSSVSMFQEKNIPFYFHDNTYFKVNTFTKFEFGETINIGSFIVKPFKVKHDVICCGFNINDKQGSKITIATDIGSFPEDLDSFFLNSDLIIIESNYDKTMLENTDRHIFLKERILNNHLSNEECAKSLYRVLSKSSKLPRYVFLAHISQEANSNSRALKIVKDHLNSNTSFSKVRIFDTYKEHESILVRV